MCVCDSVCECVCIGFIVLLSLLRWNALIPVVRSLGTILMCLAPTLSWVRRPASPRSLRVLVLLSVLELKYQEVCHLRTLLHRQRNNNQMEFKNRGRYQKIKEKKNKERKSKKVRQQKKLQTKRKRNVNENQKQNEKLKQNETIIKNRKNYEEQEQKPIEKTAD